MNRTFITMVLTATMATGCAPDPMIDGSDPTLETMEGTNGSPGNNGLLVTTFQAKSAALRSLMGHKLFTGTDELNLNINVINFLGSQAGRDVFDYAVQCALPENKSIVRSGRTYTGKHILTTTTQWTQEALDEDAKEDLFACIVAHLNPLGGDSVPIFLSGPAVHTGTLSTVYPVKEALWTAELSEVGVTYHVWPLFTMPEMCAANPLDALNKRVCGQNAPECFLEPHQHTFTDCVRKSASDDGQVECLGKRAIMTRLKNADFLSTLYPDCFPTPG